MRVDQALGTNVEAANAESSESSNDECNEGDSSDEDGGASNCLASVNVVADEDGEPGDPLKIHAVVGKRQVDAQDIPESDGGLCKLIWWEQEGGSPYPKDECTWEALDRTEATLVEDMLVGQRVCMRIKGKWGNGTIIGCVERSMYQIRSSTRNQPGIDLELPPQSNCTEWHLDGVSA